MRIIPNQRVAITWDKCQKYLIFWLPDRRTHGYFASKQIRLQQRSNASKHLLLVYFSYSIARKTYKTTLNLGSIPAFIEIGDNFGGATVGEDNLADQLINSKRGNVMLLGDDTWFDF